MVDKGLPQAQGRWRGQTRLPALIALVGALATQQRLYGLSQKLFTSQKLLKVAAFQFIASLTTALLSYSNPTLWYSTLRLRSCYSGATAIL